MAENSWEECASTECASTECASTECASTECASLCKTTEFNGISDDIKPFIDVHA